MAVYGVDIGGTKIEIAIFDENLNVLKRWRVSTPTDNYSKFLNTIINLVNQADYFIGQKGKVGIGMPGLINSRGEVLSANIPCATGKLVANDLVEILARPVAIANDTRCFALSEALKGSGVGYRKVFGAIIGTGAAGGLCIDGHLEIGKQGLTGEYGHIPLSASIQQQYNLPLLKCGCGLMACVETLIAGPGISRLYSHFYHDSISTKQWAAQLKLGDEKALKVLSCYLDILGDTFATLVKLLEPDLIVLGGGVSLVDGIVDGLPAAIEKFLFAGFNAPTVKRAAFGDSSGVLGAALLGVGNDNK